MCELCRHHPCLSTCPNYEPDVFCSCSECGCNLYVGDTAYKIGDDYFCESCCDKVELEMPEYDDSDYKYEMWRDRQLMDEWERDDGA